MSNRLQPTLFRMLAGHTAPVLSLALSPDGTLLYSGSYDQTIRVWSTADWHCLRVLKGHGGGVRALAVAPDGSALYSAAADNTIRVSRSCLLLGRPCSIVGCPRSWQCSAMYGRHAMLAPPVRLSGCQPTPGFIMPWALVRAAGLVHGALGVPAHAAWAA